MNFINIPSNKYLFQYQIKFENKLIGHSLVSYIDDIAREYLLEIKIMNKEDVIHFGKILRQSSYKFINLISGKKMQNSKLYLLLPNDSYYEILTAMAEYFIQDKTVDKNTINYLKNKLIYDNDEYKNMILLELSLFLINQIKQQSTKVISDKISETKLKGYDKSYIINTAKIKGLIYVTLQNYFNKRDFNEITNRNNKPFLLWIELMENNKFDTQYFYTQCYLMNILNDDKIIITNKSNLYFNFKKYYPEKCKEYMAQSWNFKEFIRNSNLVDKITKENKVFIVRPAAVGAYSGKDIYVTTNKNELDAAIEGTKRYEKVLISEYITNPLLFNGKKFHLRLYFLVGLIDGFLVSKLFDFYEILTATKPYKKTEWTDKDIHDTHFHGSDVDIIYPINIIDSQFYNNYLFKYLPKIKDCFLHVSKFIVGKIGMYSQTKNAFEIFGCDVLIKDDDSIVLMEINDKVEYVMKSTDSTIKLSKMYFNTIIDNILNPILNNKPIDSIDWLYCKKI
jgi:hypothetical protein